MSWGDVCMIDSWSSAADCYWSSGSSSGSRNEYYLGGIIALLQDHGTMSTKSVYSNQYMVTDQHWATGAQIKHSTLSDHIREWRPEQNGLQFIRLISGDLGRGHELGPDAASFRLLSFDVMFYYCTALLVYTFSYLMWYFIKMCETIMTL